MDPAVLPALQDQQTHGGVKTAIIAQDLGKVNIAVTVVQTLAPTFAGLITLSFGNAPLSPNGTAISIPGTPAIIPAKSVRWPLKANPIP